MEHGTLIERKEYVMWEGIQTETLRVAGLYAWRLVAAIIILVVGIWLTRLVTKYLHRILTIRKLDPTLVYFVDSAVQVGLYGLVVIEVLHKLGVESSSLIALVGAAGFAIGFGLRGHLANVAAGLLLIFFRPFSVGDYIEGGGSAGTVEKIELMNTEVRTPDNVTVILPNSKLMSDKVTNYSTRDTRRLAIVAGLSYDADLKKARNVLEGIITEDDRILKEPKPNITIKELAESSVKVEVRVWVKSQDHWKVRVETIEKIKERFDAEGIPFAAQQTVVKQ
jgi:small conductance mechanosensitive channel